jgi:hypothetical protein
MLNFFDKTTQQIINSTFQFWNNIPKNESEIKKSLEKLKSVFEDEFESTKDMWATYAKAAKGDATTNEIISANKKLQDMLVSARFLTVLAIPGAVLMLPEIVKTAQNYGIDLVPASVSKHYKI